jgi:GNAT superfamily N-acetyltransferase
MSLLDLKEVRTARERLAFIKMPWRLYRDDPHWVPPLIADQKEFLDPKRGVFYDHGEVRLFLAYRDGQSVGRISSHINDLYDETHGASKGFFGFFECEDNQETANALFDRAEEFARSRHRKVIEGSLGFGIYDEVGILVEGFDSDPFVMNLHNPPYYRRLIENAGFVKSVDWFAYNGSVEDYAKLDRRLFRLMDRTFERSGLQVRQLRANRIPEEAEVVHRIFHRAWESNWGHTPFSEREWKRLVDALRQIVVPELTLFAEKDGTPVGFTLTIYDANEAVKKINGRLFPLGFLSLLRNLKRTRRARLILMGVLEEYRGRGIENALMLRMAAKAYEMGFEELEMSLIVETNHAMVKTMSHFPVRIGKIYRLFQRDIV